MASHSTESTHPQPLLGRWKVAALLFTLGATFACEAVPPEVQQTPSDLVDASGPGYVDVVVSYTEGGSLITCSESIPTICEQQTGPCAAHPSIGAPDGVTHPMAANDVLEVGFLCNPILDRTVNSEITPDFRVWSTVTAPSSAVVSVSRDGTDYVQLGNLDFDNESFFLDDRGLDFVRFVRISGGSGGGIAIDAIEALP